MKNNFTMKKNLILLAVLSAVITTATFAQYRKSHDSSDQPRSYFKLGTQVPFQHSVMYEHGITTSFGINAGLGLVSSPYTKVLFSSLENKGLVTSNERKIMDRSYRMGITYQLGANFHFRQNYMRVFGQVARVSSDLALTDLANLYLNTNIPDVARFLNPVKIKSTIPMIGAAYGHKFSLGPNSEIHVEGAISKTLGHNTTYKTGTFIDNIEVVNDIIYNKIDNGFDRYFSTYGWFPSVNVYYVYKF
jgi:hypothetical protein